MAKDEGTGIIVFLVSLLLIAANSNRARAKAGHYRKPDPEPRTKELQSPKAQLCQKY